MGFFNKLIFNISSLKFAIFLLIFIAISSGMGTFIPQEKGLQEYFDLYNLTPFLGFLDGEKIIKLQLNHIYTSLWFLFSLFYVKLNRIQLFNYKSKLSNI